jgi:hypothetical protein
MSLKDKMMAQAGSLVEKTKELADQGKDKVEELQAKRARDQLMEQLGNAAYAAAKGADQSEVDRLVAAIDAHDAAAG